MNTQRIGFISLLATAILFGGASCISLTDSTTTTGPAGVFISNDKGERWVQQSTLPKADGVRVLSQVSVFRLSQDPLDAQALYWSSRENGFFFSYDGGATWQQPAAPLNTGFVYSVAVNPKDKCTVVASKGGEVYLSDDCSRSWKEIYREADALDRVVGLAFNPHDATQLWMAKSAGDVLMSVDLGKSWSVVRRFNTRLESLAFDQNRAGSLYVPSRSDGLYWTKDAGKTWMVSRKDLQSFSGGLDYRRFYVHPTRKDVVYWVSKYGILTSTDGGDNWQPINLITPPGSVNIYSFAVNPKNDKEMYYTATLNNRSTLYRSLDGGKNWITKKLPSGQMPTAIHVHPTDGNKVYLGLTIPPKE